MFAASELVGQPVTQRKIAGGKFEASGVVSVPGTNGALFVDDGRTNQIFWMELTADGAQKGAVVSVPLPGVNVTDLEGITTDGKYFYAVGSQSKTVGFDGDGLIRFTFDPATKQAGRVESSPRSQAISRHTRRRAQRHRTSGGRRGVEHRRTRMGSRGNRLLLGLRAPVAGADALIVPLKLRNADGPFATDNLIVDGQGALRVAAGGAGLRGSRIRSGCRHIRPADRCRTRCREHGLPAPRMGRPRRGLQHHEKSPAIRAR